MRYKIFKLLFDENKLKITIIGNKEDIIRLEEQLIKKHKGIDKIRGWFE